MLSHLPGEHFLFYAVRDVAGFPGRNPEISTPVRDIAGFPGQDSRQAHGDVPSICEMKRELSKQISDDVQFQFCDTSYLLFCAIVGEFQLFCYFNFLLRTEAGDISLIEFCTS